MKKIGIIILVLLFYSTIKAQNFVFGAFNLTGATNIMSSSKLERPFRCYSIALTGDLEFSRYINEILAIRFRSYHGLIFKSYQSYSITYKKIKV